MKMEPVYGFMPSYPYPRDQMQYGPSYFPGAESAPVHLFMNPARPQGNCEHRPWENSYGYHSYPAQCHGCCDHGYFSSQYAWRPPYPHVPPVQYPGNYPPFPSHYVPPSHYPYERPWYGYDRDMPRDHHCCGCPNHGHSQKEQKSVKIVEEEPDGERKKVDHEAPFRFKNSPFPLVWLPPDYSKDNEHQISNISEQKHRNDGSFHFQQPGGWNGWRPVQMSKISLPTEDGNKNISNHQSRDGKEYLPFPMFWMPYMPAEKENEKPKEKNTNPVLRLESVKDSGKHMGDHAAPLAKDIQVKGAEKHEENVTSGKKEKGRDTSLKEGNENEEKGPIDDPKRKPSSPRKSSKLPPVCLRVDPLPRRKTANGSSRSPSPPRDKQKMEQQSSELSKVHGSSGVEKSNTRDEVKANERITKTIQVVDGRSSQEENIQVSRTNPVKHESQSQGDVLKKPTEVKNRMEECIKPDEAVIKAQSKDGDNGEVYVAKEVRAEGQEEPRKAKLSEEEAAVIIQSVFRGFDIRRWEPVKKLKQIAKVRERIAEVKDLIRAMELSTDIQAKRKQQTIIAETIMSLLLDLDTIQGLHPSIRDVRKAVVRELVSLQEELDSVTYANTEASTGQESNIKRDEEASQNSNEMQSDLLEPCPKQLDRGSHDGNVGIPETDLIGQQLNTKLEKGSTEVLESRAVKDGELPLEAAADDQRKQTKEIDEVFVATEGEEEEEPATGESSECLFSQNISPVEMKDFEPDSEENLRNEQPEPPQDVSGDFTAPEGTKDEKLHAEMNKADLGTNTQDEELVNMYNSELGKGESDEGKRGNMEKVLDVPVDESDESTQQERHVEVITSELNNVLMGEGEHESVDIPVEVDVKLADTAKPDDASEAVEEVDKRAGDVSYEPDCYASQLPPTVATETFGSSEVSPDREHPVETCKVKEELCHVMNGHRDTVDASNSFVSEEAQDTSSEKMPNLESEAISIETTADPNEPDVIAGVNEVAADKFQVDQAAKERQDAISNIGEHIENASSHDVSCEARQVEKELSSLSSEPPEHLSAKNSLEKQNAANHASPGVNNEAICNVRCLPSRDELNVSNGTLVEENEKLRDMVEKLIKSGEEQMNVISSLSGRVKDLEKNLSRKKKLKMKRFGTRRSS